MILSAFQRIRSKPIYWAAFGVGLVYLVHVILLSQTDMGRARDALNDRFYVVEALVAAVVLFIAAHRSRHVSRRLFSAWLLLALSKAVWSIGSLISVIMKTGLQRTFAPSVSDGFFVASYALFLVGLLCLPTPRIALGDRLRTWLDIAIVMIAIVLVMWGFFTQPFHMAKGPDQNRFFLSLIYPILDLILVWVLLTTVFQKTRSKDQSIYLLLACSGLMVNLADLSFSFDTILGLYGHEIFEVAGWMGNFILMTLAGIQEAINAASFTDVPPQDLNEVKRIKFNTWQFYLPLAGFMLAYGVLLWSYDHTTPIPFTELSIFVTVIMVLIVIRQVISMRENSTLYKRLSKARNELEMRVLERTQELENANQDLQTEVNERRRVETALRESENLFHTSVESMQDGFGILTAIRDEQGKIIDFRYEYINETGAEIHKLPREVMVGETLLGIFPHVWVGGLFDTYVNVVETGQPYVGESLAYADLVSGQSDDRTFEIRANKFGDGFTVIWSDMTERKRTQDDLTAWVAQLEQHNRQMIFLNEMGDLLQACRTEAEVYPIVTQYLGQMFPEYSGALSILNASKNYLEKMASWGDVQASATVFEPDSCWGIRRNRVHIATSSNHSMLCKHLDGEHEGAHLCMPLVSQNGILGVLTLTNPKVEKGHSPFHEADQQLAVTMADRISMALSNLSLREMLRNQAIRDPLTNLFNRRYLEETLDREMARAERRGSSIGIVMIDIDHFKRFNDTFGHDGGDTVLRELGAYLDTHIRKEDLACRYGGEEFVLIFPETGLESCLNRADEIREEVMALRARQNDRQLGSITLSMGVAVYPDHGRTMDTLIRAADTALYRAKKDGRNRVVVAEAAMAYAED